MCTHIYAHIYIYIYTHTQREALAAEGGGTPDSAPVATGQENTKEIKIKRDVRHKNMKY